MATPMEEASSRCGSWVEFSATTEKTTSPGERYFNPCERGTSVQLGGKMDETRTRFCAAMPASRKASSNEVRRSRCFPTPLVKKIFLGTMSLPNSFSSRELAVDLKRQSNTAICEDCMKKRGETGFSPGLTVGGRSSGDKRPLSAQRDFARQRAQAALVCALVA